MYGETFEKVIDLPNSDEYEFEYSERIYHGDLGIRYKQFCLFWIPLFNYGEKQYVLFNKRKDDYVYVDLTYSDIEYLQEKYGSSLVPTNPEISFWNKWGGKILGVLIIIIGWFIFSLSSVEQGKRKGKRTGKRQ